jgi:hypothetical protein
MIDDVKIYRVSALRLKSLKTSVTCEGIISQSLTEFCLICTLAERVVVFLRMRTWFSRFSKWRPHRRERVLSGFDEVLAMLDNTLSEEEVDSPAEGMSSGEESDIDRQLLNSSEESRWVNRKIRSSPTLLMKGNEIVFIFAFYVSNFAYYLNEMDWYILGNISGGYNCNLGQKIQSKFYNIYLVKLHRWI